MKGTSTKVESMKEFISSTTNDYKQFNIQSQDQSFNINELSIPKKLKNMITDDFYNVNILKQYPTIPSSLSINDILQQYLKSKTTKYNLIKKNDLLHKINPNFKLINSRFEGFFKVIDFEIQMIYINDIINNLKDYMTVSVNSIVYNMEERINMFNIIDHKEDNMLNLLGVIHLLRYIVQTPYIIKYFYGSQIDQNEFNYKVFISIIDDLLGFLDKIL